MNILRKVIGAFRPAGPPSPTPETSVETRNHTYKVTEDGLSPSARSLEEFYQIQDSRHQAQEIFRTMQYAGELASEDNSPLDTDPRPGHVKLPDHGFEAHPGSGFQLHQGEIQVAGNQDLVRTTATSDNWMAKNLVGTWNKSEATFSLDFQPKAGPEIPPSPQSRIESQTFQAESKSRARDLIEAAQYWESKTKGLDGSAKDINAVSDQIVAPGVSVSQVGADAVMAETFYTDGAPRNFEYFDLESSAGGTVVAGNREQGGRPFGARLKSHRNSETMKVVLERPEIGTTETVEWVLSDGVLHYEKYKKG
jgi:hypothetical protein